MGRNFVRVLLQPLSMGYSYKGQVDPRSPQPPRNWPQRPPGSVARIRTDKSARIRRRASKGMRLCPGQLSRRSRSVCWTDGDFAPETGAGMRRPHRLPHTDRRVRLILHIHVISVYLRLHFTQGHQFRENHS